jgi:precorrin-6x reductase
MKVLIFGGTREGRELSQTLSDMGMRVTLSVATEYGKNMAAAMTEAMAAGDGIEVRAHRLDAEDMADWLTQGAFACVIDATHPYAVAATENIRCACQKAGARCFRLQRPSSGPHPGALSVPDVAAAADILKKSTDKALLTIGSKELAAFTQAEDYRQRFFVRILPLPDSLQKALDLGFRGSHIICMQGPFSEEMNVATLKMTGAKVLVTKDSGDIGGFEAKIAAALSLGRQIIVIKRPREEGPRQDVLRQDVLRQEALRQEGDEAGYTVEELLAVLRAQRRPLGAARK